MKLIGLMLETGPPRWAAVRVAVQEGRWDEATRGTHWLKSGVGNLGARWLLEKLSELESEFRKREEGIDEGEAIPDLEETEIEFRALLKFLEAEQGRSRP